LGKRKSGFDGGKEKGTVLFAYFALHPLAERDDLYVSGFTGTCQSLSLSFGCLCLEEGRAKVVFLAGCMVPWRHLDRVYADIC
jgi:hypothetical protein